MSAPLHVAPATPTIRYVVMPVGDEYAVYRSNLRGKRWLIDLSCSSGHAMRLTTAVRVADDAARREREESAA